VALMAIKGSLKEASLPDVIQLLSLGKKTGCLAVADRQNFGYIYFENGLITYASIVNRRDRLGDMLIAGDLITAEELQKAIKAQESFRDRKLGEILMDQGVVERDALEEYLRLQIEEAVYFLFTWTSGTFNFEAGVTPEHSDLLVKINPESLLLEGARRIDEWSLIEKKVPSFDLIFAPEEERLQASDASLSLNQQKILQLLDGERDVQLILEESGLGEFDLGKGLFGLITAGFVHRVGTSSTKEAPRANEARVEEHRNLGIAFYRTDMMEEGLREFRRVADLRPAEGGAPFFLGLIALKQARWADAVTCFREAVDKGGPRPAALHNLGYALERVGQLDEAETAFADAVSRARDDAKAMTGWGVAALKREEFAVATGRLARARELVGEGSPPKVWYWAMTLAHTGEGDLDAALELAREGHAAFPDHPVLANNLAVLLEGAGEVAEADQILQAAFESEPTLPQLSKNLGDLRYRAGNYDDAQSAYERAAKLDPALGDDLYFKLGNLAFKSRDSDRAKSYWEQATTLNPGHQLARANLAMLEPPE